MINTDVFNISFAIEENYSPEWIEWDGKDLIGVYEACCLSGSEIAFSISGKDYNDYVSQSSFKRFARNRGDGYTLVKWKHHCMMAVLFYAYYFNTNSQAVCGSGTASSRKTTGATDSLGMKDTVAGGNGDSGSINFWGLENWWGNRGEWIDNVTNSNYVWTITEDDGSTRSISTQHSSNNYTSKMLFGKYIDLLPTVVNGSSTTGFCDYSASSSDSSVLYRSNSSNYAAGGVADITAGKDSSYTDSSIGSRLAYRVEYEIVS